MYNYTESNTNHVTIFLAVMIFFRFPKFLCNSVVLEIGNEMAVTFDLYARCWLNVSNVIIL